MLLAAEMFGVSRHTNASQVCSVALFHILPFFPFYSFIFFFISNSGGDSKYVRAHTHQLHAYIMIYIWYACMQIKLQVVTVGVVDAFRTPPFQSQPPSSCTLFGLEKVVSRGLNLSLLICLFSLCRVCLLYLRPYKRVSSVHICMRIFTVNRLADIHTHTHVDEMWKHHMK